MRQDAPAPFFAAPEGVGPELLGEDLGGGRQTFRLQELWLWENPERGLAEPGPLCLGIQHADPVGRRIEEAHAWVPPCQVF